MGPGNCCVSENGPCTEAEQEKAHPPGAPPRRLMTTSSTTQRWSPRPTAVSSHGSLAIEASPLSLRFKAKNLVDEQPRRRRRDVACRVLNVCVALIGIALTAPLMVLIAVAIKLTSRGPVIFTQKRVGLDRRRERGPDSISHRRSSDRGGRIFTIYKFRTMRPEAAPTKQVWAAQDDPRITLVGKFLRATRLDELPQFFNVLEGDMNIVGPRPEQPEIFAELHEELGMRYRNRQRVLPGITGLAQVEQGYDTNLQGVRRKVDLDLQYIGRRSASKDLTIMAKTVPVMVMRKVWM